MQSDVDNPFQVQELGNERRGQARCLHVSRGVDMVPSPVISALAAVACEPDSTLPGGNTSSAVSTRASGDASTESPCLGMLSGSSLSVDSCASPVDGAVLEK